MKPNIANPAVEEQLLLLRDMTKRMGVLHDAQAYQLRMWPIVLFPHVVKTEARMSIEKREIDFVFVKLKGRKPKDLLARYAALDDWTKWLLGDDWVVRIRGKDNEILHRSGRKVVGSTR